MELTKGKRKWCPNGCGKRVVRDRVTRDYYCLSCCEHFTVPQMEYDDSMRLLIGGKIYG